MTNQERYRHILGNHLPAEVVGWVYDYLSKRQVHLHITRERLSKYGDYRRPTPSLPFHEISVNGDLQPHFFFLVLLHECAHLETTLNYPLAKSHGHEWQETFRHLILIHLEVFPTEARHHLQNYTAHVPLQRAAWKEVEKTLLAQAQADNSSSTLHLDDLREGDLFQLVRRNRGTMQALNKRRTRWLCRDIKTEQLFSVSGSAEVIPVEAS
ncbi:MAG: hypothetical protein IJ761_02985 [Bacteroidales bacterium]|nr:hypothetical protein [Bacteroidales bacterium]